MTLLSIIPFTSQCISRRLSQILIVFLTLFARTTFAVDLPEHDSSATMQDAVSDQRNNEHDDEHQEISQIAGNIAKQAGIKVAHVSGGSIVESMTVYGKLALSPSGLSHVRARFSGVITKADAVIGQSIKAGQILAEVESNESLKRYAINAPFSGVVIARHANVGELSNGQILYSVANYTQVWAELRLFSEQINQVKVGQSVELKLNGNSTTSTIEHIMPSPDNSPYLIARVRVDNSSGHWAPGLVVKANIIISSKQVALRVANNAIQDLDGNAVVFVNQGESYFPRIIEVGSKNAHYSEIKSGLHRDEQYVVENSYVIKADIEKSGASHGH
ncbi:HlyD family efflux transporter periplasmic adaptor subunit [Paraglaciecola sp. 20A4]|uniref:efflux RND transporter periplasmic adaptor subunit n=1 Tax=Paraglaciecola sp. 20A4 TaxID=2687288 RepID=UPI00140981E4|nr:HlyD family efflux transporter periplasmic adaptor subunit [Paraglaciecola sp. 20A4]